MILSQKQFLNQYLLNLKIQNPNLNQRNQNLSQKNQKKKKHQIQNTIVKSHQYMNMTRNLYQKKRSQNQSQTLFRIQK